MLISNMIEVLQKTLEEKGDQELFIWVDTPDDTMFIAKTPTMEINELNGEEFEIPEELRTNDKILIIGNFNTSSFEEDRDAVNE